MSKEDLKIHIADEEEVIGHGPAKEDWVRDLKKILTSKRAKQIGVALILAVSFRLGISYVMHRNKHLTVPTVKIVTPVLKSLDSNLSLPGNLEALEQASLYAHVGGYLKKTYVDEGDEVKKGQILAEIDAPDIVDEYNRLKAEYNLRNVTRDRYSELLKDQVISQQEFDNVDAQYGETKAKFDSAAANMEYTRIRAPFSGSIARRFKYPGDLISVGSKADQNPIFLLVNEKKLRVVVNIPQSELGHVKVGNQVDMKVDSFADKVFKGTISRLDALLDTATKTQRVLIDIDNEDGALRAGMFASVVMHLQHKDNAVTIPSDIVETENDKSFVYLLVDGKAKKTPVVAGAKDGDAVEIVEGVKQNDSVISRGTLTIADGEAVQGVK